MYKASLLKMSLLSLVELIQTLEYRYTFMSTTLQLVNHAFFTMLVMLMVSIA